MLAQAAIKDGRVLVDGVAIKPAREARAGETMAARYAGLQGAGVPVAPGVRAQGVRVRRGPGPDGCPPESP